MTPSSLDSGGTSSDATSYATVSITPTSNRLVFAACNNSRASSPTEPTVSGCGITFAKLGTLQFQTVAAPANRLSVFYGWNASPTTGALTFDFGGITQNGFAWSVCEVPDVNLDSPITQPGGEIGDSTGTSLFRNIETSRGSGTLIAWFALPDSPTMNPHTGWTELHDVGGTTPTKRIQCQYLEGADESMRATWTGALRSAMMGCELVAAGTIPGKEIWKDLHIEFVTDFTTSECTRMRVVNNRAMSMTVNLFKASVFDEDFPVAAAGSIDEDLTGLSGASTLSMAVRIFPT